MFLIPTDHACSPSCVVAWLSPTVVSAHLQARLNQDNTTIDNPKATNNIHGQVCKLFHVWPVCEVNVYPTEAL